MSLYQKLIDRSTLRQGFQIPVEFHHLLKAMPGGMPQHGETRSVKVVIDYIFKIEVQFSYASPSPSTLRFEYERAAAEIALLS